MADHHLSGLPPIPLVMRRSPRARRISLRVSQLDGRVTLTLPPSVSESEALAFADSKADWVRRHLAGREDDVAVVPGALIPVEGVPRRVEAARLRKVALGPDTLSVPADRPGARALAYLRTMARDRLAEATDLYCTRLGRPCTRITLRDTRSRWGSCSSEGALMYSWRLVLAPPDVLRYVAAHEVAHLREMNHSAAFWRVVNDLHGPYEAPRDWLRTQGASLHRYRF